MTDALATLRDPGSAALDGLADVVIGHALDVQLADLAEPGWWCEQAAEALRVVVHDDRTRAMTSSITARIRSELKAIEESPQALLPEEVLAGARDLAAVPWSPSEQLTFEVINHPALRTLVREVLTASLTRFAQRLRTLDQGVLGGLGGRAVKRGRGLLGGSLGAAAGSIVGAVREEVEAAMDGRVAESVGQATEEAVRQIARWVADPAHADQLAAMRVAAVDAVASRPVRDLVAEADEVDTDAIVDLVLDALQGLAARDDLAQLMTPLVEVALEEVGDQSLGTWLDRAGNRDAWITAVRPVVRRQLAGLVAREEFGQWWSSSLG